MTADAVDHWAANARQWARLGPPLRPSPADVDVVADVARDAAPRAALLLGVTPEIATLPWPYATRLVAVDRSLRTIRGVWPQHGVPAAARALCGSWLALPVAAGRFDLVVGDACCNVLAYPDGYQRLARELRRVLRPGGSAVLRVFVQPEEREPLDRVADDLAAGRGGSFHALKLRLLMALQASAARGVALRDFGLRDPLAIALAIASVSFFAFGCGRTAQSTSVRPPSADAAVEAVALGATTADELTDRFGPADARVLDGSPVYRFRSTRHGDEAVTFRFADGVLTKICRTRS